MKRIDIGPGLSIDPNVLVATRLLVQANSGGGKTRTLRRLLEQSHGALQHLVIDPEGEYHTLREKFDYILAAPSGGDTVAHPRTAKLLAERLLELGVSAILDIYELNPDDRKAFVANFLNAMVNAPRALWHPVLVVLDEAHVYAPEKGDKSTSCADAVKAMASRGRKRGFALVPATQRLAKLSKDVAAECNNKLIGRCTLDVDIARAAEELGFTTKEQKNSLRQLDPGQFYAFGAAFGVREPQLVLVGAVKTSHPEAGQHAAPVPPPTSKVKALLPKLSDLPAEAEARERSIADLQREIAGLKKELAAKPSIAAPKEKTRDVQVLTGADRELLGKVAEGMRTERVKAYETLQGADDRLVKRVSDAAAEYLNMTRGVAQDVSDNIAKTLERVGFQKILAKLEGVAAPAAAAPGRVAPTRHPVTTGSSPVIPRTPRPAPEPPVTGDGTLTGPERKILSALAELEALTLHPADKLQLGLLAGYTNVRSGGFSEPLGQLLSKGYATSPAPGRIAITDAGRAIAGAVEAPQTSKEMQDRVMSKLTGPERKLLGVLIIQHPKPMTKDELGAACNYTNIRSGGFSEPLGRLRTLGLIESPQTGVVVASSFLFLE